MAMTAKDLIAKSTELLARKGGEFEIDIENVGVWRFFTPSAEDIHDADTYAKEHKFRNSDSTLVFNCVVEPNLYDPELVQALKGAKGATDYAAPWIIDALLEAGQVQRVAELILRKAGFTINSAKIVESVNSNAAQNDIVLKGSELKK